MEAGAEALIREIDGLGGMRAAVEAGFPQRKIEHSAYLAQKRIESEEDVVVGRNRFVSQDDAEATPTRFEIDPAIESDAARRLSALRARAEMRRGIERPCSSCRRAVADDGTNLFASVLAAV